MTAQEIDAMMQELILSLRELSVPIPSNICPRVLYNARAKRRLGCCYDRGGSYEIELSSSILEEPQKVKEVLIHELLHTCRGCHNHGKRWKQYGERVKEAWGISVVRAVKLEGEAEPLRQEQVKYVLQCEKCGAVFQRKRLSKAVKFPNRYRCRCGGKLKRLL